MLEKYAIEGGDSTATGVAKAPYGSHYTINGKYLVVPDVPESAAYSIANTLTGEGYDAGESNKKIAEFPDDAATADKDVYYDGSAELSLKLIQ